MLDAKPTVFISHSGKFKDSVASVFKDRIESLGMQAVLVEDMPIPAESEADPEAKVDYYLTGADMMVVLLTPDDRLASGEFQSRLNIVDEIGRAKKLPHIAHKIQVFKAPEVRIHSNINPTYVRLDTEDPGACLPAFERQAIEWGVLDPDRAAAAPQEKAGGPVGSGERAEESEGEAGPGTGQAVAAVEALASTLRGEGVEGPLQPEWLTLARAHLASTTALGSLFSTALFGVHELNGLYRRRAELTLGSDEVRQILRTVICDLKSETAPGWYWLRARRAAEVHAEVIDLALTDADNSVRAKAMRLLTAAPRQLDPKSLRYLVTSALDAEDYWLRNTGVELLAAKGDLALAREFDSPQAAPALLAISARETPAAALRELLDHPYRHDETLGRTLLTSAGALPVSALREGLESIANIQSLCLEALHRSSRLRREDVIGILEGEASTASVLAIELALKRRWSLDPGLVEAALDASELGIFVREDLRREFLETQSAETLSSRLEWIGASGWVIYAALGAVGPKGAAARARRDLDSDFAELRERYEAGVRRAIKSEFLAKNKLRAVRPDEARLDSIIEASFEEFIERHPGLTDFTLARFQAAALGVLAEQGSARDARYGRRFIESEESTIATQAARLLGRHGKDSDTSALIAAAGRLYREDRELAARAALAICAKPAKCIERLIATETTELVKIGIEACTELKLEDALNLLVPLLKYKMDGVRSAAIDVLWAKFDSEQRARFADIYLGEGGYYYYNVIGRADRELHAPGWVREAFAEL